MQYYSIALGDALTYEKFKYPAGEMQVRLKPHVFAEIEKCDAVAITARIRCADDLIEVCMLCDAARGESNRKVHLILPYLPYARADRRFVDGDCSGLQVFANLLNSLNVTVHTLDVHSSISRTEVKRLVDVSPLPFIQKAMAHCLGSSSLTVHAAVNDAHAPSGSGSVSEAASDLTLLFPDDGARKRYSAMGLSSPSQVLHCKKVRDKASGKLSHFSVPRRDEFKTQQVLLIDDICDGGGTFLGIAEGLKDYGLSLSLYVTHGIFSKGLDKLSAGFRTLYTTDSFQPRSSTEQFIVYPIESVLADSLPLRTIAQVKV